MARILIVRRLKELIIDIHKDWLGYAIKNLGAPTIAKDAFRLGDVITDAMHGSRGSGLHADSHARLHDLNSTSDHTGILDGVRGGLGKALSPTYFPDYQLYFDYTADEFVMRPPTQPSGDINYHRRVGTTAPERWYTSPITGTPLTTGAPTANVLRVIPFIAPRGILLDRIAINVTAAVSGYYRLGIYYDSHNVYPGTLILDAGTVSTGTTGVKSIAINLWLDANTLYWLACVSNAAPTIRCFAVASMIPILGFGSDLGTAPALGYSVSYTYNPLPNPFPSGASVITATPIPAIFVRGASY